MSARLDPQADVEAPVRRAIDWLIAASGIHFGAAVLAVVLTIEASEGPLHAAGHFAMPGLLLLVLAIRTVRVLFRSEHPATETAWARVREMTPRDTELATFATAAVPFGWFVGGAAILFRHVGHHDLATLVGLWTPAGLGLWTLATLAWIHDCRDRLAVALIESDRRFRKYWERVPKPA